jgi:hypothetical protein
MLDLHLCLSASVNVRLILHTQPLGLYKKNLSWESLYPPLFLSLTLSLLMSSTLQMANTRSHNTNAESNDVENNNTANPPLTVEQVLLMLAQMLQTM